MRRRGGSENLQEDLNRSRQVRWTLKRHGMWRREEPEAQKSPAFSCVPSYTPREAAPSLLHRRPGLGNLPTIHDGNWKRKPMF